MVTGFRYATLVSFIFLASCASTQEAKSPDDSESNIPQVKVDERLAKPSAEPAVIDLDELERKLNLPREFDQLGYHERKFNACLLGFRKNNCVPELFVMINFQVVCRDSNGTVEHVSTELIPFANKNLALKVGNKRQTAVTDAEGYSQMRFIAKSTARGERFFLNSPPNSMMLRAGEISKVVAPNDWCD
jgi:hypothetical protein